MKKKNSPKSRPRGRAISARRGMLFTLLHVAFAAFAGPGAPRHQNAGARTTIMCSGGDDSSDHVEVKSWYDERRRDMRSEVLKVLIVPPDRYAAWYVDLKFCGRTMRAGVRPTDTIAKLRSEAARLYGLEGQELKFIVKGAQLREDIPLGATTLAFAQPRAVLVMANEPQAPWTEPQQGWGAPAVPLPPATPQPAASTTQPPAAADGQLGATVTTVQPVSAEWGSATTPTPPPALAHLASQFGYRLTRIVDEQASELPPAATSMPATVNHEEAHAATAAKGMRDTRQGTTNHHAASVAETAADDAPTVVAELSEEDRTKRRQDAALQAEIVHHAAVRAASRSTMGARRALARAARAVDANGEALLQHVARLSNLVSSSNNTAPAAWSTIQ